MKSELKDKIEAELLQIQAADPQQLLRAEAVVEFAENPATALHQKFNWDDTEAARQWRLHTARGVIRTYVAVLSTKAPEKFRAFVSLSKDRTRGGGYRSIASVLSDDDMREQLLADAYRSMKHFMNRYGSLQELAEVFKAMEAALPVKATG